MVEKSHTAGWWPHLYEPLKGIGERIADWFAPRAEAASSEDVYEISIELSERRLRESLKQAELMAPCVLWIDEIEKGLATGDSDNGTSRRVLGTFLTWLAEQGGGVFVVATANEVQRLPPELVRKGRFDELFFVDLPDPATREEILEIHIKKREMEPKSFDIRKLAHATEGFSGAELEQGVVAAWYTAHADGNALGTGHLLAEFLRTRPLSVVMAERVATLRAWADGRCVPAA